VSKNAGYVCRKMLDTCVENNEFDLHCICQQKFNFCYGLDKKCSPQAHVLKAY
jgi:hypothetical protein